MRRSSLTLAPGSRQGSPGGGSCPTWTARPTSPRDCRPSGSSGDACCRRWRASSPGSMLARGGLADVTEVRDAVDLEAWLAVRNANHPLDERTWDAWRATRTSGAGGPIRQFVGPRWGSSDRLRHAVRRRSHGQRGPVSRRRRPGRPGRGIGTAVTLAALGAARAAGVNRAVLTATELGSRLYRGSGSRSSAK